MTKRLNISQLILERNVPANILNKLYNMCQRTKSGITTFDNSSNFVGDITTGYTYEEYISLINEYFPSFRITPAGLYVIIEDPVVKQILMDEFVNVIYPDAHYEGVIKELPLNRSGYNHAQYAFKQKFRQNTDIVSFNEMSKLTNCKRLSKQEFYNCTNLVSVDLTNIEEFDDETFRKCYKLEYFNGPNSVSGDLRLPSCIAGGLLNNIFMWDSVNGVYQGPKIKRILDLGNCTTLPINAFNNNKILEYVEPGVLEKLITIQGNAFAGCTALVLNDLKLPNCTSIMASSFSGVTGLKKISELGICAISSSAFSGCTSLTEITQEALDNIISIGSSAFYDCSSLVIEDLKLPRLTTINDNAFYNTQVKKITDLGTVTNVTGFSNCKQLTNVVIPTTATALGGSAFSKCTSLTSIDISNITTFWNDCLRETTCLPDILYLPKVTTSIAYNAFRNTQVRSIYLPHMKHTNGPNGTTVPACLDNIHRGNLLFECGSSMDIVYFKDLEKINGDLFGGRIFNNHSKLDIIWYSSSTDDTYPYHHIQNGVLIHEMRGNLQIPFLPKEEEWEYGSRFANIKYLVINNVIPPTYWMSLKNYNGVYGACGLYGRSDNGLKESFTYLAVPRASISAYYNWDAFHPDFSSPNVSEEDRQYFISVTSFTNIIAIESMGHFATKAEWDAAPNMPDGVHSKNEYLIEEYMDLTTPIQWDEIPSWSE